MTSLDFLMCVSDYTSCTSGNHIIEYNDCRYTYIVTILLQLFSYEILEGSEKSDYLPITEVNDAHKDYIIILIFHMVMKYTCVAILTQEKVQTGVCY